jgi:hypothetical protein
MHGSLVGLPEKIDSARVHELRQQLTDLWQLTMGRSPGGLEADLELSRKWFDPVAQGERLRRELSALPTVPKGASELASPWTYHVGENKWLVTPEGRCVLDLLEALPIAPIHLISDDLLVPYDRLLGRTYQRWGRHRLESVVGLLRGSDKPLQIPAAAVVIALLVNRCTSEERALVRFAAGPARDVVDGAFFAPVKAFHETLVPKQVSARAHPRLISGWMLYEARRRLGDGLVLTDARRPRDGRVWIRPDQIDVIIGRLARDLMRGHRVRATPETLGRAFDALVDALRLELPKLAGYGLVHERPPETRRLRQRLIDSLSDGDLNGS